MQKTNTNSETRWLWHPYLPKGHLSLLHGDAWDAHPILAASVGHLLERHTRVVLLDAHGELNWLRHRPEYGSYLPTKVSAGSSNLQRRLSHERPDLVVMSSRAIRHPRLSIDAVARIARELEVAVLIDHVGSRNTPLTRALRDASVSVLRTVVDMDEDWLIHAKSELCRRPPRWVWWSRQFAPAARVVAA